MPDRALPDLTFPKMAYGTHAVPWDLRTLLVKGGAQAKRSVARLPLEGPIRSRIPFVARLHEVINGDLERGASPHTVKSTLNNLYSFFAWSDEAFGSINENNALLAYKAWTESLVVTIRGGSRVLSETRAYRMATTVGGILARALRLNVHRGSTLVRATRLKKPKRTRTALSSKADKQNLDEAFAFGQFTFELAKSLSLEAIRGPLPVLVSFSSGQTLHLGGGLRSPLKKAEESSTGNLARFLGMRASLAPGQSATTRHRLVNLRIELELLLLCAHSGMNLAQAASLPRSKFRFQSDGEYVRVYKARRQGEVVFRIFKRFRSHFETYISWLDTVFDGQDDKRLFPFIYVGKIPAQHMLPVFSAVRKHCKDLHIKFVPPSTLRNTRVNWMIRRSGDPSLTAEMHAHLKETLLSQYEKPHHQRAASDINRFHRATDPSLAAPGPGLCADTKRNPLAVLEKPKEAPEPDCISPDGCLFCQHHRDVSTKDYCWKLACHSHIKLIELSRYKPPTNGPSMHPAEAVVDRIAEKMGAIAISSEMRAAWVKEATDRVRAGRFHPAWDGFIQLLEAKQ